MLFGATSVAVAALRLPVLVSVTTSTDTSHEVGRMVTIASLEVQCAIVAVNLPSLTSLFKSYVEARSSVRGQDGAAGQGSYKLSSLDQRRRPVETVEGISSRDRVRPDNSSEEELFQSLHHNTNTNIVGDKEAA